MHQNTGKVEKEKCGSVKKKNTTPAGREMTVAIHNFALINRRLLHLTPSALALDDNEKND